MIIDLFLILGSSDEVFQRNIDKNVVYRNCVVNTVAGELDDG